MCLNCLYFAGLFLYLTYVQISLVDRMCRCERVNWKRAVAYVVLHTHVQRHIQKNVYRKSVDSFKFECSIQHKH